MTKKTSSSLNSESQVESRLLKQLEGFGLCLKWVSPGNSGVPDRIIVVRGRVFFVELKKPKSGKLSALQKWRQRQFLKNGVDIVCLWTFEDVDLFIDLIRIGKT